MFSKTSYNVLLAFLVSTAAVSAVLADIPTVILFASIVYPILQRNDCQPGKSSSAWQ